MKQKLIIFLVLMLMAAILVGLNAASYTRKEKTPDNEFMPNRSTFNPGATGTQALYSLLSETGRNVTRWQEPPAALLTARNGPAVFVVIGSLHREFTEVDVDHLLRWVSNGGHLVVIDREPPEGLVTTTANWSIVAGQAESLEMAIVDPADQKQMTAGTAAVKGVQPTVFTQNVNAIQPSRFASSIVLKRYGDVRNDHREIVEQESPPPPPKKLDPRTGNSTPDDGFFTMPSPTPLTPYENDGAVQAAPVVHFADAEKNLLVDAPFGMGKIVFLADPYIVSNRGIALADNAQLAINLVTAGKGGSVAFDEYHQGFGSENNGFLQFFAGTPVIAIFLQTAILIGFVFFSRSRRFARPVAEPEPDRLSKLEYVAAMAELQNRTKAFDLAIENIYNDFRRRAARYFGLDNFSAKSTDLARLIAERTGQDQSQIEETLFKCEEIIRGEPTDKKEIVRLTGELRSIEQGLGMSRGLRKRV